MRIFLICIFCFSFNSFPAKTKNLKKSMKPDFYFKRDSAYLNVGLLYYGNYWKEADLEKLEIVLKDRFLKATENEIELRVIAKEVLSYKNDIFDYPLYENNGISDPERLQRLWYYDNVKLGDLSKEIYLQAKKSSMKRSFSKMDVLLAVTGAQFNALGFADGRIAITELPREIAWGLDDQGLVSIPSHEQVVDELIHEIGHTLFIGHASTQCQRAGWNGRQIRNCCHQSAAKNDIMSYCRDRRKVSKSFYHKFEDCNMRMIKQKIVPRLLRGGKWEIQDREVCR